MQHVRMQRKGEAAGGFAEYLEFKKYIWQVEKKGTRQERKQANNQTLALKQNHQCCFLEGQKKRKRYGKPLYTHTLHTPGITPRHQDTYID